MSLIFLESLGTTELLVILIAALVLFGPRKLPQLARSLGKSMAEFRRTSDDFRRTWEREVAVESAELQDISSGSITGNDRSILGSTIERGAAVHDAAGAEVSDETTMIKSVDVESLDPTDENWQSASTEATEPSRKRDWL